jgi:hypothetical protein
LGGGGDEGVEGGEAVGDAFLFFNARKSNLHIQQDFVGAVLYGRSRGSRYDNFVIGLRKEELFEKGLQDYI